MPYDIRCIIPSDRYCRLEGFRLVPASRARHDELEAVEAERLSTTTVLYVNEKGEERALTLLELSSLLNFAYSSTLIWMSEGDLRNMQVVWGLSDWTDSSQSSISPSALSLGIVYKLENGLFCPAISIKWVDAVVGHGLFTTEDLENDEFIIEYTGVVLETQSPSAYSLLYPCLEGGHEVNASDTGNLARFINHSPQPNASFQRVYHEGIVHTVVRLTQSIKTGTQITVDYSPSYWVSRNIKPQLL